MVRTFTFEVLSDGYKIYINGNPHAGIVQQGYMPYVDITIPIGTVEYYTKCAELNIAELQKADTEAENYVTDIETLKNRANLLTDRVNATEEVVFTMMM